MSEAVEVYSPVLKPVCKVGTVVRLGPLLHSQGHYIGNITGEFLAILYGRFYGQISVLRKVVAHGFIVEDILTKERCDVYRYAFTHIHGERFDPVFHRLECIKTREGHILSNIEVEC